MPDRSNGAPPVGADHPVAQKLQRDVVPYLVSADQLVKRPVFVAYSVYSIIGEFLTGLAGVGLAPPLLKTMSGSPPAETGDRAWMTPLAVVLLVAWVLLRIAATSNEGAKRATLMRSCRREVQQVRARLARELSAPEAMTALEAIQKEISALVDRHIAEGSWPWSPVHPRADELAAPEVERLVRKYGGGWASPPPAPRVVAQPQPNDRGAAS